MEASHLSDNQQPWGSGLVQKSSCAASFLALPIQDKLDSKLLPAESKPDFQRSSAPSVPPACPQHAKLCFICGCCALLKACTPPVLHQVHHPHYRGAVQLPLLSGAVPPAPTTYSQTGLVSPHSTPQQHNTSIAAQDAAVCTGSWNRRQEPQLIPLQVQRPVQGHCSPDPGLLSASSAPGTGLSGLCTSW